MVKITSLILILVSMIFQGCSSSDNKEVKVVSPDNKVITENRGPAVVQPPEDIDIYQLTEEEVLKYFKDQSLIEYTDPVNLAQPEYFWYMHIFTYAGIEAFYQLNKHVPASFQEYIDSGIPMIIPVDDQSGKVYHLVEKLNMADTSGFTFTSDGIDTCRFTFIVDGEEKKYEATSNTWADYKDDGNVRGVLAGNYSFDGSKREFTAKFFQKYATVYAQSHYGQAPEALYDLFEGRGQLIEAGWKWTPAQDGKITFLEIGFDTEKEREYHIMGATYPDGSPTKPMTVCVNQLYGPDKLWDKKVDGIYNIPGINSWVFTTDNMRSDVFERKPYFTADKCYEIYKALTVKK